MRKIRNCYKRGIVALVPTYVEMKGDVTKILTKDKSEHYVDKNIKRIFNILAKKEFLDLRECRKYYGNKLGCKNLVPIPLNKDNIFIPIKTRKALNKNDSSFSYINLKHIEEILEDKKNGIIILKDRREIITRQRVVTIEKHVRNGNLLKEIFEKKEDVVMEQDIFSQYNAPVTKGDLMSIKKDILYIKQKLNT